MKLNYLLITFLLLSAVNFAQVNTEKYRTPKDLQGLAGYLELSGTIKTGNVEKTEAAIDGRLDWRVGKVLTFLIFESDYEWIDGQRSSNEGLIHLRHVQKLIERLKVEVFGQVNYDKKILVNNRELIGAGLRFTLYDFNSGDLTLGTAYMFEHENYDLPQSAVHPSETKVSRWSNYFTYRISVNGYVTFGGVLYYQPMFSEFSDYRILYENNLEIKLTDMFSLAVNFRLRHDSMPPDGIKETDTKTDFGIAFKF